MKLYLYKKTRTVGRDAGGFVLRILRFIRGEACETCQKLFSKSLHNLTKKQKETVYNIPYRYEEERMRSMTIAGSRNRQDTKEMMIADYSRKRLLTYADSFQEIAHCLGSDCCVSGENRQQLLENYNLWEKQQILSSHMAEVSRILAKMATEVFHFTPLSERQRKKVVQALRTEKIVLTDIYYIRNEDEDEEERTLTIGASICSERPGGYHVQDVADMLSVLLDKRLSPAVASPYRVDKELKTFLFVEEPRFLVVPGYAKAVKEGEELSGDNYSIIETVRGGFHVFLADGMGSGEEASRDSEWVLDLMQTLTEAGYDMDTAMNLLNNALLVAPKQNMSTLDVCSLDLYNGMCRFRKAGAATTFLKSNTYVEQISMQSLPLGIFQNRESGVITRELIENDYIIMVTDGVIDALEGGGYEDMLQSYIEELKERNPEEMARKILQFVLRCSGGRIADDMTVVVLGVYCGR